MPLGARDIMMVVRARDLASRTLRNVGGNLGVMGTQAGAMADKMFNIGSALTTIGLGVAAVGGAGLVWLERSTDAAIKYNNEAGKTLTQVDEIGASLEEVKDIARDVAREIPAPFEQMQEALYDIFSSMDVNMGESRTLLREFSRAGVAGQVDLQSAARGTIGIMNAYRMEAGEVHRVNDIMFQLVRKGVGTYQEFADTIGLATPAAVRAGQSFETLAGMMAFLTRNGLDASAAAAAAGRALENVADPRIVKRLEGMGVAVKDARGEFRPLVDIIGQLAGKLGDMTAPQRAEALQTLLKGAGNNVQARRFWNLAISNFDEFQQRVDEMINSSGALDDAYSIMFEQPQSQIQLLKNQYEVLRTEIGDELIPVKLRLAQVALRVLDAWNSLSEGTQGTIIKVAAAASAFMLLAGIAITVVGGLTALVAIFSSVGIGIGAALAIIGGFAAALVVIPALIAAIIIHWDKIKNAAGVVWGFVKDAAGAAWQVLQDFWDWLSSAGVSVWHEIQDVAEAVWGAIVDAFNAARDGLVDGWNDVTGVFRRGWQWFDNNFGRGFRRIFEAIGREVPKILEEVGETFEGFAAVGKEILGGFVDLVQMVVGDIVWAFDRVKTGIDFTARAFSFAYNAVIAPTLNALWSTVQTVFSVIATLIGMYMDIARTKIEIVIGIIMALWDNFGSWLLPIVKAVWDNVATAITTVIEVISNVIQFFLNLIQGDWGDAWNNIKAIGQAIWESILRVVSTTIELVYQLIREAPGKILGFLGDVGSLLYNKGRDLIQGLINGILNISGVVWRWFQDLPTRVLAGVGGIVTWLFEAGKDLIQGLINGIKNKAGDVSSTLVGLARGPGGWVQSAAGALGLGSPSKIFFQFGKWVDQGFINGIKSMAGKVDDAVASTFGFTPPVGSFPGTGSSGGSTPPPPPPGAGSGLYVAGDLVVREESSADDLDWWSRRGGTGV